MSAINKKTITTPFPYVGGLNGQKVELYASSLADAKEQVVKYFKPSKKNMGLVWVQLATES